MNKIVSVIALFSALVCYASAQGIGDGSLYRTFGIYAALPMNSYDAINQGWTNYTDCDPNLGVGFSYSSGGPDQLNPITLYMSAGGQIAGLSNTHYGQPDNDYWLATDDGNWILSISFRPNDANLCDPEYKYNEPLGVQVVLNQGSEPSIAIPLDEQDAISADFTEGGCIGNMGTHWSLDLATAPYMSWVAANLLPIMPMYHNGQIDAVLFNTPNVQVGSEPLGPWEPPLVEALMCYNWCNDTCTWSNDWWNTMHIFFTDYTQNTCAQHCPGQKK